MGRFDECPHCGGEGICPPGQCPVRDSPDRPKAPKARKMPAAVAKQPARRQLKNAGDLFVKPVPNPVGRKPIGLNVSASGSVAKRDVLDMWEKLPDDRSGNIKPIPYGYRGSAIQHFSIRASGEIPELKDLLSRNKWLLRYENSRKTRLHITLLQLKEKGSREPIPGVFVLYIQIHQRG